MPSDPRIDRAASALAEPLERFQSALATAVEQLRTYLATHRSDEDGGNAAGPALLGPFASGRIDTARFAALVSPQAAVDVMTLGRMERAFEALAAMTSREDPLWRVNVEPGGDLRTAVARALDGIGRAFGAARVAELSRTGRYDDDQHGSLMESLPFSKWNPAERKLAPPLVVHVDGTDLRAAGLVEFLDGALKIVLVVRGDSPPAPLVRLISPGFFVLQTLDGSGLDGMGAWSGPAVAALVSESAARFLHDPRGGALLTDRIVVDHLPAEEPSRAVGGISAEQQAEDLRQLVALTTVPEAPAPVEAPAPTPVAVGTAPVPAAADPVDKLAAWLLSQADGPGTG